MKKKIFALRYSGSGRIYVQVTETTEPEGKYGMIKQRTGFLEVASAEQGKALVADALAGKVQINLSARAGQNGVFNATLVEEAVPAGEIEHA